MGVNRKDKLSGHLRDFADLSSSLTNFSVTSMTMTLCYHLGDLFHRLPLLDVLHDQLVKHLLLDVLHGHLVTHALLDVLHDHLVKHLLLPILDA